MNNKFDAKLWFVENESELKSETEKSKNAKIDFVSALEPFEDLINTETKITSKMAKEFANKLNSSLCTMKRLLGLMSLITLILGILLAVAGIPICLLIFLVFIIGYLKVSKKVSVLKKTIISLKTPEKFELYYDKVTSAQYTNLPFRYDNRAVYNNDNAIFSIDNICLIYIVGKKVHFGTIKGDLIKFDKSLSKENQDALIKILKTANPNIMIGSEYIKEVNKLIGK